MNNRGNTGLRALKAALSAALLIAAAASAAWACTAAMQIENITPASGPGGANVIVTGFAHESEPVEIHWNNMDGPLMATVSPAVSRDSKSPRFSASFTAPADQPRGIYYVVAIQRGVRSTYKATESFSVTSGTPGAGSSASSDLWLGLGRGRADLGPQAALAGSAKDPDPAVVAGIGLASMSVALVVAAVPAALRRRGSLRHR